MSLVNKVLEKQASTVLLFFFFSKVSEGSNSKNETSLQGLLFFVFLLRLCNASKFAVLRLQLTYTLLTSYMEHQTSITNHIFCTITSLTIKAQSCVPWKEQSDKHPASSTHWKCDAVFSEVLTMDRFGCVKLCSICVVMLLSKDT